MILKYAIALALLIVLATVFAWAFLPPRHLPGNRARHLQLRLHLRLHPGKGFAHAFSLWLRWGRLAVLRRSGRIRRSLPLWYRLLNPAGHSVFLGRAHYRHRLHVPLEEHLLVVAPPRTYKTAFLADVILRYPGPVIATTTKPDIYALTAAVRVLPAPGTGFYIPEFLREVGTLYMIAEAVSEEAPVAPIFAAMATEIHYIAAQMGQASGDCNPQRLCRTFGGDAPSAHPRRIR